MKPISIAQTDFTPRVHFDPEKQHFEISGISRPEDATYFYSEVNDWIESFAENMQPADKSTNKEMCFVFKLSYFNSPSAKAIFEILKSFKKLKEKGYTLNIDWYYDKGDDLIVEDGEDLADAVGLKFNIKQK